MIDVQFHYRYSDSQPRRLPAVPAVGHYVRRGDGLWMIDAAWCSATGSTCTPSPWAMLGRRN